MEKEKPWYKKVKVMTAIVGFIIELAVFIIGTKLAPERVTELVVLMSSAGVIIVSIITGHAMTDAKAAAPKK